MTTAAEATYDAVRDRLRARKLDAALISDIETYRALCEQTAARNIIALAAECERRQSPDIAKQLHGIFDDLYSGKP